MSRTGRRQHRAGTLGTRDALLGAARAEFGERGYDGASIRGIAGRAGVDPALVYHYFSDKQALFVAAIQFPANPAERLPAILGGDPDRLGERLVGTVVPIWDGSTSFVTLMRSAVTNPKFAATLREFLTSSVLIPLLDGLDVEQKQLRASLVASQLLGIAMARYVLRIEPLAGLGPADVAAATADNVQHYLTGTLPTLSSAP